MLKPMQPWPIGRYQLSAPAWIAAAPGQSHALQEVGATIFYQGKPAGHMIPLDSGALQAVEMAAAEDASRLQTWGW